MACCIRHWNVSNLQFEARGNVIMQHWQLVRKGLIIIIEIGSDLILIISLVGFALTCPCCVFIILHV